MIYVHYTNSIEAIQGILKNGLLLSPLERKLMHLFSNDEIFSKREPQQFGLTSFRREGIFGSRKHKRKFGSYGIVFKNQWIKDNDFQKVRYLRKNSRYHKRLQSLFNEAKNELDSIIGACPREDQFPYMAYTNKSVCDYYGAGKYSLFLTKYEKLEPFENKCQNEWRAIQNKPIYTQGTTKELVQSISEPGWNNLTMTIKFSPRDISHFVTTFSNIKILRNALPTEYQHKTVRGKIFT